jgi:amino acid adenylation domain-containing protein
MGRPPLVHEAVAEQARRAPEATALVGGTVRLTYREIDERASRLAHRLRSLDIRQGAVVGVLLERSPELVVSLLAVLKAGAAYLPLDPAYPRQRLEWMLADSGAAALVTREALALRLPSHPPALVCIGSETASSAGDGATPSAAAVCREDLAYVVYTSGSTGRPKGVLVPHGALAHHGAAVRLRYALTAADRVLQFASPSFDVAAEEVFATLASGATLVLRLDALPESFDGFRRFVEREGITVLNLPASFWHSWVDDLERTPARLPESLRLVIAGNETVLANRLRAWRRMAGDRIRWLNAYGPTEATITDTVYEPAPGGDADTATGVVPIGRPLAGVRALVLDPELRPVPPGISGELHLGGPTLAYGYLGRPDLTAERFVPDPCGSASGARLYRTGDRARVRPDGEIEFLGRTDDQIKVRGFRIEPGEVEAALLQHPAVRRAVVVAREVSPGDTRLVAYTVGSDPGQSPRALRSFLRERLPEPAVPSWFVRLDELPLLPSGKVDRRGLPPPPAGGTDEEYAAPATPTEEVLAGFFAELFGVEAVGRDDDFFELGGHSLLATRLAARVREAFGVELPLPSLFAAASVRGIAAAVERAVQGGEAPPLPPIARRPRPGPFPLSFPQERIWFLGQLAPESIAYNTQLTVHLAGPLDVPALAAALGALVRRHEIFRTSFEVLDGRPVQWVHPPAPARLPVVELSGLPAAARAAEAAELSRREVRRRFDVARPPLIRWTLLRLGPREHRLLQVEHHFVHDGWSLAVLFRDLRQLYRVFADRGRELPAADDVAAAAGLPELPVQFADFAAWQREWMQGEVLAAQLAWWRERLAGMPPALELPTDRARPKVQSFRGEGLTLAVPCPLYEALRAVAGRNGATPFMTWLAIFAVLLGRWSGQEDLVVGSSVANRRQRETEDLIGMIVNNLVLRVALGGDAKALAPGSGRPDDLTFSELLARVREITLGAYAHQDVPFEKLVEVLQPERDLGRNPLFQVAFGFHDSAMPDLDLGALTGRIEYTYNRSAKFDLNLVVVPPRRAGEEVQLLWEYSTDLFDATTLVRLHRHYETLLAGIAAQPEAPIGELPLLGPAERHQVLVEWNATAASLPSAARVHELVEEQAALRSSALAVTGGGRRLTYGELDARANRLAHRLRGLGVGPEVTVALLMARSPELVAAMLGVLKAGGAYLPLDPAYPAERLAFMLEDAGAPMLLTTEEQRARLDLADRGVRVLAVDSIDEELAAETAGRAPRRGSGEDAAYVIYTSGSTGRPKGVQVSHANLAHLVAWHRSVYAVTPEDRATQLAGVAFDASVWEIWPYLTAGASLHIPDEETRAAAPRLVDWLTRERITVVFVPTPLAEALLEEPWPSPAPLRALLTGGDRLRRRPRSELSFTLYNHYGPTEGTVVATAGATTPAGGQRAPSIGRPIANARAYLVDRHLQPAPIGVPGELCVAGKGVARGYRGRPDLTAERFAPDTFSGEAGARLYRSGDLVRWRTDGRIEFLGRIDQQVKLRGFRIEPGEIEAVIAEHPGVREAAVLVREDVPGTPQLVAYVVADPEASPADLLELCRRRLPDYMVPAAFVSLSALPVTPNGKLDRAALPAPAGVPVDEHLPPHGPLEEAVAQVFARTLGVKGVGAHDGFFALGGHSLTAGRLLLEVNQLFQSEVRLVSFFARPTVTGLASALVAGEGWPGQCEACARRLLAAEQGRVTEPAPDIPHRAEGAELPLSFAQQRLWFLDRLSPGTPLYNVARAFHFPGRIDPLALGWALAEVTRRHEALRTTFVEVASRPRQVIGPPGSVSLPIVDLSALAAPARQKRVQRLAAAEARRPFDLAAGPLLRATLLLLGEEGSCLLLAVHHIVADGWSMAVLCRELGALYDVFVDRPPGPVDGAAVAATAALAALPVQYADFALWQRGRLQGELLEEQIAWWRERLAGCPRVLDLPADRPRPPVQDLHGARRTRRLAAGLGAAVQALARRSETTPFTVSLAAVGALLARVTGREDLLLGSPVANRTRAELAGLVGFFANTLVLRVEATGDPEFTALLGRVREMVAGALSHQELPFERLVEALQPDRDLSGSPLFQVMFMLEEEGVVLELGGRRARPVRLDPGTAATDLTLWLEEGPGGELAVTAEYAVALFEATTVDRLLGHFETLLSGAVVAPAARLSSLPLLTARERAALLVEWNDTAWPVAAATAHDLFAACAALRPGAVAIVFAGEAVTYGELRWRSARLAGWLRALGIGPEARVGICLERSVDMVVAVLAVLEAGGAYVPMDPAFPRERLALLLEDSRADVLVTRRPLAATLPQHGARVVHLEPGWEESAPVAPARAGPAPDHLAYILYTSGSTGRPKGVQITHRSLVNFLAAMRRRLGLGAGDALLAVTTLSFDIAGLELLLPLVCGGRVVLASDEQSADGHALAALIATSGATAMQGTPATWRLLLAGGWRGHEGLAILCGGEALPPELAERLHARGAVLWNLYGPTETTIWSTAARIEEAGQVTAGRPIDNTHIYVVDQAFNVLPPGVPGEVLIGGAGLSRGYFDRPDLSAERFVPDPFAGAPGARLYRTGDLGRLRPDGRLEILGRLDQQVKVRGFRIELGEIEAFLARHPTVRQAVVTAEAERTGERRLVAWFVPRGEAPTASALRDFLRQRLPEYMVPSLFVPLAELPLTPNGKVDRRALPAPAETGRKEGFVPARGRLERAIAAIWSEVLGRERVGVRDNFFDLGGHSLLLAEVQGRLATAPDPAVRRRVTMVDLFRCATVESLARLLGEVPDEETLPRRGYRHAARRRAPREREPVAVVGMAGRFPRCRNVDELWESLRAGRECLTVLSEEELLAAGAGLQEVHDPRYVRVRGVLEDVDLFDAAFFGITPREAEILDPQHRLFLECAWEALEDAGYDPARHAGRIGVYAGSGLPSYLLHNLASNHAVMRSLGGFQTMIANDKDYLPTRVSYKLNLRGPSLSVQTGCSASLVAVHLAVQSLFAGECDMALAGGVKVSLPQTVGYLFQEGGILSLDGHCRAFDARAQGTVGGSGVGIVVLKRLSDALADGDRVRAVILGTAINNDGADKVGYTAPSVDGQAEVVAEALAVAGVDPRTISYVEAHGTGTALGDPIEVAALTQAFGETDGCRGYCALGSIKTNLGHLDTAAGIAGLIKTVLALERRELPPSLHFEQPNPAIDFAASPFYVSTRLSPWVPAAGPRRAGVSSFGIGGTNAHVVLEEAPSSAAAAPDPGRPWQVVVLSARTTTALRAAAAHLRDHLRRHPDLSLADAAYTLQVGRAAFEHRLAVLCRDADDAAAALAALDPARVVTGHRPSGEVPAAFLFPGQGSQHPGMAADLYDGEPVFGAAFDRCAERLAPALGRDLRRIVHPPAGEVEAAWELLEQTAFTQPALFAVEYALAQLWMEWGLRPQAMAGHSVGELVAACLAGVFSLEDALDLVALRGRLVQGLPGGAMLSVRLAEAELLPLLEDGVELAAVNGPAQVTVAGPPPAVAELAERLSSLGVAHRRLRASHAFHTAAVEPILDQFAAEVARRRPAPPRVPYLSNVTGDWITVAEATDPAYWARHLRGTVRFSASLAKLLEEPGRALLEIGPGRTLTALVQQQPAGRQAACAVASLPHPDAQVSSQEFLLATLARLWTAGVEVDWQRFHQPARRRRVALPTYPFERQRYWIEAALPPPAAASADLDSAPAPAVPAPAPALYDWTRGSVPFVAPETMVEQQVTELWQEFLGLAQIGLDDDFFTLGGDSLTATQVVSRLGELYPLELGLKVFFEAPTVRQLAARIEGALVAGV